MRYAARARTMGAVSDAGGESGIAGLVSVQTVADATTIAGQP